MSNADLPYYFEVPEIPMPPFNLDQYLISDEERAESRKSEKTVDQIQGKTRTNIANWYQTFINVEANSRLNTKNYDAVGMLEEANIELGNRMREWLHDTLNLKFTHVVMLRTPAGKSGRWHSEGPAFHNRRCGLNFPMSGDFVKSKAQWATFPRFKDVDPINNERMSYVNNEDMKQTQVLSEWTNQLPGFQSTLHLHRGYNEESDVDRVILTASVEDVCDLDIVYKKYMAGNLFK